MKEPDPQFLRASFAKPAQVLRQGGAFAVVGMRFVLHGRADAGWMALQADYEEVTGAQPGQTITPTMAAVLYVAECT